MVIQAAVDSGTPAVVLRLREIIKAEPKGGSLAVAAPQAPQKLEKKR